MAKAVSKKKKAVAAIRHRSGNIMAASNHISKA